MNVLYISYDGALDPLGRSQVIPYLEGLRKLSHRITLLTFEKPARWANRDDREALAARLKSSGIDWRPLRYHKRFSAVATAYDLAMGYGHSLALRLGQRFDLIHARSYPSTLLAWRLARALQIPFIFDMRGLYAEERVEGGHWPADSVLYRLTKNLERKFLRDAAAIVTLTEASVPKIAELMQAAGSQASLTVIPTCVDTDRFQPVSFQPNASAEDNTFTVAYVGSIGTWYMLDEMLSFGRVLLAESSKNRLLFLTNDGSGEVSQRAAAMGIDPARLTIQGCPYEQVPAALARVSATFYFIRATSSKIASAATKFGESLALGLPVLLNPGIGDAADIVAAKGVGVVIHEFTESAYRAAVKELKEVATRPEIRQACRTAALEQFALTRGVEKYDRIYRAIG